MSTHAIEADRRTFRQVAATFAAELLGMPIDGEGSPELLERLQPDWKRRKCASH
jgi:hypothetical protein